MTEAGKKWLESKTGEASSFDVAEAEFWIRAFCEEVERRTMPWGGYTKQHLRGLAFDDLKRELLGE